MARRPVVATLVTTVVGAVLGSVLGALVGRVIALVGDETVQVSVPMVFCGTLGYFVGGASAAKGSVERFGARRAGAGTAVALLILVALVGGASVLRLSGVVVFIVGVLAAAVAGVAAASVSGTEDNPVARTVAKAPTAAVEEGLEPESELLSPPPMPNKPVARKIPVAPRTVVDEQPESDLDDDGSSANWSLDEPTITPPPSPRPRRDRPLRRGDA